MPGRLRGQSTVIASNNIMVKGHEYNVYTVYFRCLNRTHRLLISVTGGFILLLSQVLPPSRLCCLTGLRPPLPVPPLVALLPLSLGW